MSEKTEMEVLYDLAKENIFSQFMESDEEKDGILAAITVLMTIA